MGIEIQRIFKRILSGRNSDGVRGAAQVGTTNTEQ